jgi:OmpA-OmpF porin, OOP family
MKSVSFSVLVGLALALAPRLAAAQATGFALDNFQPAERGSQWFALDDVAWTGHMHAAVGVTADLGVRPLSVHDQQANAESPLVRDQLFAHLGASLAVSQNIRLGLSLPVALVQSGESAMLAGTMYAPPDQAAFGDLRLGADVRLAGAPGSFALAVGANLFFTTGSRAQFTGDGTVRIAPHLLVSAAAGPLVVAGRAGFEYHDNGASFGGVEVGNLVTFGGAAGLRVFGGKLLVGPEIYGQTSVASASDFLAARSTPVEALLGIHAQIAVDLRASAGVGVGLTDGFGSPQARGLFGIEWTPVPSAARATLVEVTVVEEVAPGPRPVVPPSPPAIVVAPPAPEPQTPVSEAQAPAAVPEVIVTHEKIQIRDRIEFATDSDDLVSESDHVLGAVADTLLLIPEITRIRVEGYTDGRGDRSINKSLSERRARAVVAWLVAHGVASQRLEAAGYGPDRPIDRNDTAEGRRNNRRVEFSIVEQRE